MHAYCTRQQPSQNRKQDETNSVLRTDTRYKTMECLQRAIKDPLGCITRNRGKDREGKAKSDKKDCKCVLPQKGWRLRTTRPSKNTGSAATAKIQNDDSATLQCYHADECSFHHSTDPIPNPHFLKQQQSKVHVGVLRKKELPNITCSYAYMSNHVMVNRERQLHKRQTLTRCAILDDMARSKAKEMAAQSRLLKPYRSETMVENVERGPSLQVIHQLQMHGMADNPQRANILSDRFVKFGMGAARGDDGNIYLSQLFQGGAVVKKKRMEGSSPLPYVVPMHGNSNDETKTYSKQSTNTPQCTIVRNIKSRPVPNVDKYIPDPLLLRQQKGDKQLSTTHNKRSSTKSR